jgi:nucleoside-diphosphate-sugar epimerase
MVQGWRICVTGGAGFIGSHLVERLVPANRVVVFDNFRRDALTASGFASHAEVEVVRGDVLDAEAVRRAIAGCDAVVHLASIAGVDTVLKHPVMDFSTSEVFGRYAYHVTEFDSTTLGAVGEARWTYAVAKLATEHLAMNYHKEYGLASCSIRPFNIYGPGQVGEGAVHHFIMRALKNEPLMVHNDGAQIRAWCYVDDIVDAILLALEKPEAAGHAFNIGNPRSTVTIYNLAREIVRLSSSGSRIEFVKWPHADVEIRVPSVEKAKEILGYEAKVDLEEGLLRTVHWYRRNRT